MSHNAPLISFNMRPVKSPWGGSSPFVSQMTATLKKWGCRICYDLRPEVDLIVLIDPRKAGNKPYNTDDIRKHKAIHPHVKVLHRVNECDARKGTDFMDDLLEDASTVADFTVFISQWLQDYFVERWFDPERPHSMIYNGADPSVFHPIATPTRKAEDPFRLVTHHWSNHWMKGFDVYQQVDELIAAGDLPNVELIVIGRWPEDLTWKTATTHPPCTGKKLARLLRKADAYLTASRREPCGMHHVEGAQCGLPMIYHEEGGGIVEAGERYGIGFTHDVQAAITTMRDSLPQQRQRVLQAMPSGETMCREYASAMLSILQH